MASRADLAAVWPPTAAVAKQAGHRPMSAVRAIREKCLDCCAGQIAEVRACEAVKCPLWPFRIGKNVWDARRSKNPRTSQGFAESGQNAARQPLPHA